MIEEIFSKRKQTRFFDENTYPERDVIENILIKAYQMSPSKQNLMPYKVHILGPNQKKNKLKLYRLASKNEQINFHELRFKIPNTGNMTLFAPYILLFEKRLPEPNDYVLRLIKKGHRFNEIDPDKHSHYKTGSAVEIGLFASLVTGLCLEQDICLGYTQCLPDPLPFKFIQNYVFLAMGLGYPSKNSDHISNETREQHERIGETKPKIDKIIIWHD